MLEVSSHFGCDHGENQITSIIQTSKLTVIIIIYGGYTFWLFNIAMENNIKTVSHPFPTRDFVADFQ